MSIRFTGKFLIATTKQRTGEYQANCKDYVALLRKMQEKGGMTEKYGFVKYEKFTIRCFECEDASMAVCEKKKY